MWTENEINTVLTDANTRCEHSKRQRKDWARSFLKTLTGHLDTYEKAEALQSLFIDKDPVGIEYVISLTLIFYVLRDEMLAWFPDTEFAPGLRGKKYAQFVLHGLAEHMVDADVVTGFIDYIQGEGKNLIDPVCDMIEAVHELHKEIITWGLQ